MNQAELITHVAEVSGLTKKDVEHALKTLGEVAQAELQQGGELTLPGIGKLSTKQRAERTGHNPATGESVQIAAKRVPHFSASKALKDAAAG